MDRGRRGEKRKGKKKERMLTFFSSHLRLLSVRTVLISREKEREGRGEKKDLHNNNLLVLKIIILSVI